MDQTYGWDEYDATAADPKSGLHANYQEDSRELHAYRQIPQPTPLLRI